MGDIPDSTLDAIDETRRALCAARLDRDALRAELLERAIAHEEAVHYPFETRPLPLLVGPRDALTLAYLDLKAELLSRCELTDPVVEAARAYMMARHPFAMSRHRRGLLAALRAMEGDSDAD